MNFQYPELLPHEQKTVDALNAAGYPAKRVKENEFRSACPGHKGDSNDSLATYLNRWGVWFKCWTKGCTHEEVCASLELKSKELKRSDNGLSLLDYSNAKQIDQAKLVEYHVREVSGYKYPRIEIPYYDFDSNSVGDKERKSMSDGVIQKSGNTPRLYGMWRHAGFTERIVIVEGESDCHTLWAHGEAAVGVPGAPCVKAVISDLERLVELHPDLQIFVYQEPDVAGHGFVKDFAQATFKDRIKVVRLSGFKDASELHCHNPEAFIKTWKTALDEAIAWSDFLNSDKGKPLASLKQEISATLMRRLSTENRQKLIGRIINFLKSNERLLVDVSRQGVREFYILADNGSVVRIKEGKEEFEFCMQSCGVSPSDSMYKRLIHDLRFVANEEGKEVRLKRYSEIEDYKTLYISSGTKGMVVVEMADDGGVGMRREPNGKNGVIFSSEFCYPEWVPAEPMKPEDFALFNPCLEAPDQVPQFTPQHQVLLLKAWLVGVFAGVKVPILTCTGSLDSGKSKTLGGIARLFISDEKDVSNIPSKESDFYTSATSEPVYLIDNLDGRPEKWVPNALATAATGGDVDQRKFYTNSDLASDSIIARLGVTTRDHMFAAGRPDIQSRLLPLFFAVLPKAIRKDESYLFRCIYEHRNNLLTYLAECAAIALLDGKVPEGFNTRFQSFGKITESLAEYGEEEDALNECKLAISFCISSEGNNGLMRGIRLYFQNPNSTLLQGSASDIAEELGKFDKFLKAELSTMSARHISNALGEIVTTLKTVGYVTKETNRGGTKWYSIAKVG